MSESGQVIEIERNENVAIEVNNSPAVEPVTVENVFVKWKRMIIGVSLISLMVLPLLGGALVSYFLRRDLHEPVDPYNVWPDTDYKNQERPEYMVVDDDKGYSLLRNHYLLIKNGDEKCFTVSNSTNADMYMAVYMVENLFGYSDEYVIHVVTSTRKSALSPGSELHFVSHHYELEYNLKMEKSENFKDDVHEYYQKPGTCLATNVVRTFKNFSPASSSSDQKQIMKSIGDRISEAIKDNPKEFYYPTYEKKGSYAFSYNGSGGKLNLPLFNDLRDARNNKRESAKSEMAAAEEEEKPEKNSEIVEKPKYKKIDMRSLKELS